MTKNAVLCIVAAALLGGLAALAQDSGPAGTPAAEDDARREQADAPETGEPVSEDVFIPSEEVQAAEELTFPVNI